jgi:hypothetical protein
MKEPKDGYVRCGIIHLGAHLKFDVVNETPQNDSLNRGGGRGTSTYCT